MLYKLCWSKRQSCIRLKPNEFNNFLYERAKFRTLLPNNHLIVALVPQFIFPPVLLIDPSYYFGVSKLYSNFLL